MATPDRDESTPQSESHTTREREVIVTDNGGSRSYGGLIVAILAIIVFGVLGYLFLGAMSGDGDGGAMPDEVNVDVEGGTDGG